MLRLGRAYALALIGCLAACSGGSSSDGEAVLPPPVAPAPTLIAPAQAPAQAPAALAPQPAVSELRIYRNPYQDVDWTTDLRLKSQHHDHVAGDPTMILGYDRAKYDVVSLMDYSGNKVFDYAYRERTWPPERWLPAWMLKEFVNIKLLIPNAEEVGSAHHVTSPFLETYIESAPPLLDSEAGASAPALPSTQYRTLNEAIVVIRNNGGMPCLAHPFTYTYANMRTVRCAEMYNAFAEAARADMPGTWLSERDGNALLLEHWDHALQENQEVIGIAVNDHYGPYWIPRPVSPQIQDSGKIIVMAKGVNAQAYRNAFERGAVFAIRDNGMIKDRYPTVFSVTVAETFASIDATGSVTWKTGGVVVSSGPVLLYTDLPAGARYVRAEVANGDGSVVYTQAFVVRPKTDADGDYDVDGDDRAICAAVVAGVETQVTRRAACGAI